MLPAASYCPAAAVPIAPKIPAPMTAPIASIMRSPAPRTRRSDCGVSSSLTRSSAIGLRLKSCRTLPLLLLYGVMLRIDGHTSDVIDVSPVTRRGWFEQIAHHPFRELAPVTRVLDGRSHLDLGDSTLRRNPEADLVALAVRVARRARRRGDRPQRRGGEDITRGAARARAGIGPHARPRAGALATACPRTLARTARRSFASPDRRGGREGDSRRGRRHVELHPLRHRRGNGGNRDRGRRRNSCGDW